MSRSPEIDELHLQRDKPVVFAWLRSYLRWHLAAWNRAFGLHWSEPDIDRHIDDYGLVDRDWDEIAHATDADGKLVRVARAGSRAIGLIYVEKRLDRYLQISIGRLSWLFVDPLSRGSGVSQLLIGEAHRWMQSRGLHASELFVTAENLAAVKAYGRAGYAVVDHRMVAPLDPSAEPGE